MKLKVLLVLMASMALILSGCASKGYVDEKITEAQAQNEAKIQELESKAALNSEDIQKLQTLSGELSKKADMALNQAKGFENYQVIWEGVVNFDFDEYELTDMAKNQLDDLGMKMTDHPRSLLELVGHTDQTGSKSYNFELGIKRAESVKKYMIDQYGIALYRMFVATHGETKPVAMPDEKNANSKNRRVVLKLWGEL
jgi:outer membrane protein OmpA-like peptidoglycan-associated protein